MCKKIYWSSYQAAYLEGHNSTGRLWLRCRENAKTYREPKPVPLWQCPCATNTLSILVCQDWFWRFNPLYWNAPGPDIKTPLIFFFLNGQTFSQPHSKVFWKKFAALMTGTDGTNHVLMIKLLEWDVQHDGQVSTWVCLYNLFTLENTYDR